MRIEKLELNRYGHFTDKVIDLPSGAADFHLVVGRNEAGKSTIRSAIREMLFGMDRLTPFGWLHGYNDMRISGLLVDGGQSLEIVRKKGNKNTLLSPSGEVIPESKLQDLLGRADEAYFERMYSLDIDALVAGGQTLLSAEDDIGRLLFQSASGLAEVGRTVKALGDSSEAIWAPTAKKGRVYYDGLGDLKKADSDLRESMVKPAEWAKLVDELAKAVERHEAALQQLDATNKALARLNRLRRVKPELDKLTRLTTEIEAEQGVPAFGPSDAATFSEAKVSMEAAAQKVRETEAGVLQLREQVDAISVDSTLVLAGEELRVLNERRIAVAGYQEEVQQAKADVRSLMSQAKTAMDSVGLPWPGDNEIAAGLPTAGQMKALESVIAQQENVATTLKRAKAAIDGKQRELERLNARLEGVAGKRMTVAVGHALGVARGLGGTKGRVAVLEVELQKAQRAEVMAFDALGRWKMTAGELRRLLVPSQATVQGLQEDERSCRAEIDVLSRREDELDERRASLARKIELQQRTSASVSSEDLVQARRSRDEIWSEIQVKPEGVASRGEALTKAIIAADGIADVRFSEAEAIQAVDALRVRLSEAEAEKNDLSVRKATQNRALQELHVRWAGIARAAGLEGMQLEAMGAWAEIRQSALDAAAATQVCEDALQSYQQSVQAAVTALRASLPQPPQTEDMDELLEFAGGLEKHDAEQEALRGELNRQVVGVDAELVGLGTELRIAEESMSAWTASWDKACSGCGLHSSETVEQTQRLLAAMLQCKERVDEAQKLQTATVERRERELQSFEGQAADLLSRLNRLPADGLLGKAVATAFAEAGQAKHDEATKQALVTRLETAEATKLEAGNSYELAKLKMEPLFRLAGTSDTEAVEAALRRFERVRSLHDAAESLRVEVQRAGDGMSLASLAAECEAVDFSNIVAEIESLDIRQKSEVEALSTLAGERKSKQERVDEVTGSSDGAAAEGARQEAIARMTDAMEDYFKLKISERLLRWAMEQFRLSQQGPMLERASSYFSKLTKGSFERLTVDFDESPPKLEGRRPNKNPVGIKGMSEGTRHQLYLGLRLAALDLQIDAGQRLPFVADDLFQSFDDERSESGFEALKALSSRCQVIFLTHHEHLVEPARKVFGQNLNVVRL